MAKPRQRRIVPCPECIANAKAPSTGTEKAQLCNQCLASLATHSDRAQTGPIEASSPASSMELLLPNDQQSEPKSPNQGTSGASTGFIVLEPREAVVKRIAASTRKIVELINRNDYEDPFLDQIFSDPFYASDMDQYPSTNTWREHMATFRVIQTESPDYHMRPVSLTVDVDRGLDGANAFIVAEISGRPPGVKRESLGVLRWELKPEGWRAVSHTNMRAYDPTKTV
ncbi:uncharacterized protein LTR77_008309 [Saxophila tyrrhenica]|uniref:SnoaL-like domain-containing protein n=1 Tax=Saxophila tyrrhenica TaxID=1690608 RepID=A0AAV9P4P6_9PEZI|nr:hypothetical protein LTR77_008309 [Saxophila tyrrhenica]